MRLCRPAERTVRSTFALPDAVQRAGRSIAFAVTGRLMPPRRSSYRIGPRIGRSYGAVTGKSPPNVASARRQRTGKWLRMRENVLGGPAGEIEPGANREELEARGGKFRPAFPRQHDVELALERMQVEHIVGRVSDLRLGQGFAAPVGGLLL